MTVVLPKILEGIRRHESLPGMAFTVNKVVTASRSENNGVTDLASVILSDPSLTQRVLRVANSAAYAWDGGVDTVSKAIMLLGFDTVRMIALSLILLDRLAEPKKQRILQSEISAVLAAATLARAIAEAAGIDSERAAIKALLRQMGKLMTAMYATDEYVAIRHLASKERISDSAAAYRILGVRYEVIAEAAIAEWSLPEDYRTVPTHAGNLEGVPLASVFGCDLTEILIRTGSPGHPDATRLIGRHAETFGLDIDSMRDAVDQGISLFANVCRALNLPDVTRHKASTVLENARATTAPEARREFVSRASADRNEGGRPANYREALFLGIGDIASAVSQDEGLTTLIRMATDILHDAMGYQRSLFLFRDASVNRFRVRYATGRDAEHLLSTFWIPMRSHVSSVFHAAIERDACIHIEDSRDVKVLQHLPPWFKGLEDARSFVVLPIVTDRTILGAIYGDRARADIWSTPEDLEMLVTLKNQIVMAVKARQRATT